MGKNFCYTGIRTWRSQGSLLNQTKDGTCAGRRGCQAISHLGVVGGFHQILKVGLMDKPTGRDLCHCWDGHDGLEAERWGLLGGPLGIPVSSGKIPHPCSFLSLCRDLELVQSCLVDPLATLLQA